MTQSVFLLPTVDDYLGPGDTRFFSRGYRRAEYDVSDVVVRPGTTAPAATTAVVSIHYPRDWSTKAGSTDLRPHLSTIDVFVLGVQLSELHLTHTFHLSAEDRRAMWLRRVTIRAGGAPQEELDGLRCAATPRSSVPAIGSANASTVLDCTIGAMRVTCEFEHRIAGESADTARFAALSDALGDQDRRYFGAGFQRQSQRIEDVRVDMAKLHCSASTSIEPGDGAEPADGTEAAYQPSVSMIDCFVVSLQLAQVLMYELDSVSRQDSNTLWMLKTVLQADRPRRPREDGLTAETAITGKHLVPLRGKTWRNVDLRGDLAGITLRSSFAHQLPDAATGGTP